MSLLLSGAACTCCPVGAIGSSPDLTPADLVGTWPSDQGPTITRNADGTFTAERLNGSSSGRDYVWRAKRIRSFFLDQPPAEPTVPRRPPHSGVAVMPRIHRIALTTTDLGRAGVGYDTVLGVLGYRRAIAADTLLGWVANNPKS